MWSGGIFVEDVGFERHPNPYPLSTTQANLFGRVIYDRACSISAWTPLSRESFGVNDTAISRDLLWHTRTAKTLNEQPFSQWVRTELGLLLGMRTIAKLVTHASSRWWWSHLHRHSLLHSPFTPPASPPSLRFPLFILPLECEALCGKELP